MMGWWRARCPSGRALSRAFSLAAGAPPPEHVAGCPRCLGEWEALARLRRAARIAVPPLAEEAVDRIRTALLTDAAPRRARVWPLAATFSLAVTGAIAVVVVLLLVPPRPATRRPPAGITSAHAATRGEVHAVGEAVFVRLRGAPDEAVQLRQGRILVEVQKLAGGERFRVLTGDGEVEVRGTSFEVRAADDRLTSVSVNHGRVEVRLGGHPAVLLSAGQSWERPPDPGPPRPAPRRPAPSSARKVAAGPLPESAADLHFRLGWRAMNGGDLARAQRELAAAIEAAPAGGIAEDARFWRAVSLDRAHRPEQARQALEDYLQRHGSSPRAGQASAMLGWLLLDAGELAQAEARFGRAALDAIPEVRRSATAGLEVLKTRAGESSGALRPRAH